MKKQIVGLTLGALFLSNLTFAQAESRFINGTGQDLKIDVLSKSNQTRDVNLPANPSFTKLIGSQEQYGNEILVVKDQSGKELLRQSVQVNQFIGLYKSGDSLSTVLLGYADSDRNQSEREATIINASGSKVKCHEEYEDFSVRDGEIQGAPMGDTMPIRTYSVGAGRRPATGTIVKSKFSAPGAQALQADVVIGNTYILTKQGGALKLELLRTQES